jgi:hypothetical protein
MTTLVVGWASRGQTDDGQADEIAIPPRWKVGDERRYERVKTRRKTQGGKETFRLSARAPIDVRVVEAGEKGYLVRWRIGETTPDDLRQAADPTLRAMNRLVEGLEVDIELDDEATITGVRNWAEMKATATKILEIVVKAGGTSGEAAKAMEALRPTLEAMFATKESVEQIFTKEPQVFFLPIGRTYPGIGKPIEYDDKLPNPLGGPPFPCKGKFTLTSYDVAKGRAVVTWEQIPDPREAARIILDTLKAISERLGQKPPNSDEAVSLTIEDHAELVIDTNTGWVEQFTYTRSVTNQGNSQEDILSMTRQPEPR